MFGKCKDLLGIRFLPACEITEILEQAEYFKRTVLLTDSKKTNVLSGKNVNILFYENSTRTRTSFEMAAKIMGASVCCTAASSSSVKKGESLVDTVKTLDSMGPDIIIIRHGMSGAVNLAAEAASASVINAGDGMCEHPTQALLDAFTIKEVKGTLSGLKVAIVGDIAFSRVARSNIWLLRKMGAEVFVSGPSTLIPPFIEDMGAVSVRSVREAVTGADVVIALRIQVERQKDCFFPSLHEYASFFGLNDEVFSYADKEAVLLHPGPVNRGVELTSSLADSCRSCINLQITNGVAVRMAVMQKALIRG